MNEEPPDLSIKEACIGAHEYYISLKSAGFTRLESLYLVAYVMTGGPKPPEEK